MSPSDPKQTYQPFPETAPGLAYELVQRMGAGHYGERLKRPENRHGANPSNRGPAILVGVDGDGGISSFGSIMYICDS